MLSVVGARPQFVKLAPVDQALRGRGHTHVIVHTGQHYDPLLSQAFFDDLAIEPPSVNLEVGSHGHAIQTARVLAGLDPVLQDQRPDWVLVYGDTNSTLGGSLAAAQRDLPLAHLEAGLRSFDRRMPEERNRVVADHTSESAARSNGRSCPQSGSGGALRTHCARRRRHGRRARGNAGPRRRVT